MDTTQDPTLRVRLDRAQREAIRDQIELAGSGCGDASIGFQARDRSKAVSKLAELQRLVRVLDTVGWTEPPGTPDELAVTVNPAVRAWARSEVGEIADMFRESELPCAEVKDTLLDALSGLHAIAAGNVVSG